MIYNLKLRTARSTHVIAFPSGYGRLKDINKYTVLDELKPGQVVSPTYFSFKAQGQVQVQARVQVRIQTSSASRPSGLRWRSSLTSSQLNSASINLVPGA
jgi:hypothetical protein